MQLIKLRRTRRILISVTTVLSLVLIWYFLKSLHTLSLFPIYPDEIAERTMLSRFWYDFPMKSMAIPMCQSYIHSLSWVWYFPGGIEWILHGHFHDLRIFRASGMITGVVFTLLLTFLLFRSNLRLFSSAYKKLIFIMVSFSVVASLLYVGVMPFFLVTTRPEQTILLMLTMTLVLFSIPTSSIDTWVKKTSVALVYLICFSTILYMHPKGLYLTPVLFLVAYKLFSHIHCKTFLVVIFIMLSILTIGNYYAWLNFYDCHNYPAVNNVLLSFNINIHDIVTNPRLFFSEILTSAQNYQREINQISFQSNTDINYLPQIEINNKLKRINSLIHINYISLIVCLLIASIALYVSDIRQNKILTKRLLVLVLCFCTISNLLLCKSKNWYDAGYLWSLLVIALVFLSSVHMKYLSKKLVPYLIASYLLTVGICSLHLLISTYKPHFLTGYSGPSIALIHYNYAKNERDLETLERLCDINVNTARGLITDDATYFHFQKAKYPMAYTYLYFAFDQQQFRNFLLNKPEMDGLIVRRTYISPDLQEKYKKYAFFAGEFFCVPKSKIDLFFEDIF